MLATIFDDYPMRPFHTFQRNGPTVGRTGPTDIPDRRPLMYGIVSDVSVTRDDAFVPRLCRFWASDYDRGPFHCAVVNRFVQTLSIPDH